MSLPKSNSIPKLDSTHKEPYAPIFSGKAEQVEKVKTIVASSGLIPQELAATEVQWFYYNLGIDDVYFISQNESVIASHILSVYASKIMAYAKTSSSLDIYLEKETENESIYLYSSIPGVTTIDGPQTERKIDDQYLDTSTPSMAYRLESYRNTSYLSEHVPSIRCYFVKKCHFPELPANTNENIETRIEKIADTTFLDRTSEATISLYQSVINEVTNRHGPVILNAEGKNETEWQIIIGYKQQSIRHFFSAMSDLYHFYHLFSTKKYVEQFSNGITIVCMYLSEVSETKSRITLLEAINQIMREASLIYCLPRTSLQQLFQNNILSVQETTYSYCAMVFALHFLNRLGNEYEALRAQLDPNKTIHQEMLLMMKKRLRQDTFNRAYVVEIVKSQPQLLKILYVNFALNHYITPSNKSTKPTLSYQRITPDLTLTEKEINEVIKRTVTSDHELQVFKSFLVFNKSILKTNFYQPTKISISFRLEPSFLSPTEYPQRPFGLFMIIGCEFRGFHIRFQDIARGGIRIVTSRNNEAYDTNCRNLFDENYGLAATQQRKNKDIPEGGSKGTILLDANAQDKACIAFQKYIDAIFDLTITGSYSPGIKEKLVDLYGKNEILFFGPDEGTAFMMDWACTHARARGVKHWKAITTGKGEHLGGIPHDLFGMTTYSIHEYVTGVYRKLGLMEEEVTKIQTGGPDGDLGSNEILVSKDKTIGVVDGSGVLYDPLGINRKELLRLAKARIPISNFDVSKLSMKGFQILVDQTEIKLPSGEVVMSGLKFRNDFHLSSYATADIFVPCGGRPESVDMTNVKQMFNENGECKFKIIIEGANLFFTQEARLYLEEREVILYKDASANKGGVTSSSLEVLASLCLNDQEYQELMCPGPDGKCPAFYLDYVHNIHENIAANAEHEFECIWREHKKTGMPRSVISDELSFEIVRLTQELQETKLWDNISLRTSVISEAIPKVLLNRLGISVILERLPEEYLKLLFGSFLASRYLYSYGVNASKISFFEFMNEFLLDSPKTQ